MDSRKVKKPSEGAKNSRPSVSGKKISRSTLPSIDPADTQESSDVKRTRAHLMRNLPGIGAPTARDKKRALESVPEVEAPANAQVDAASQGAGQEGQAHAAKIIAFKTKDQLAAEAEDASAAQAVDVFEESYHDPAEVEAALKKLAELDENPFEGVPTPVDVISQAKLNLGEDDAPDQPQFDFSGLDASVARTGASDRKGAAEQSYGDAAGETDATKSESGESNEPDAESNANSAGESDTGEKPSADATAHARRVHKVVDAEGKAAASTKRRTRALKVARIVGIVALVIVVLDVIALAVFSVDRWLLHDDAADIQGNWLANGTTTRIVISGESIELTDDVSYGYTLDTTAKTIEFTFATSSGHGRYWFDSDRRTLVIEDGTYDALGTFGTDIQRAVDQIVSNIQGKTAEYSASDTTTVFTRMSSEEEAGYAEAEAERIRQAQQQAIADREARDVNGNGIDDNTGKAIRVVDVDGDGVDDETGQLISEIDKDGDGILDERDVG